MQLSQVPHTKIYFRNLDSVRFIAALMVYMQHGISPVFKYMNIKNDYFRAFLDVITDGGVGVSIFFVLSGFLITYTIRSEIEINGSFSIRDFYIRRVLRIWPLFFAVLIFSFFIYPGLKSLVGMYHPLCSRPLYHFTFLSNFDTIHIIKTCLGSDALMQNITWSVSIEEQFYIFWPLLFLFLPRRYFLPAILSIAIGSIIFRIYNSNDDVILYFHTFSVMINLAVGGLFAYMIKTNERIRNFFRNTNYIFILLYFIILFALLMWHNLFYPFKYGLATVYAVLFAFIIASQSMIASPSVLELGNIGIARKLGKYTYGIYLLHPIALTFVDVTFRLIHIDRHNLAGSLSYGILGLALTLGISYTSYELYEKKFIRLKQKFSVITTW